MMHLMVGLSPKMYVDFIHDMERRERHSHIGVNMNSIVFLVYSLVAESNCLEIRSVGKHVLSFHIFNRIDTGSVIMVNNTKTPQKCSLNINRGQEVINMRRQRKKVKVKAVCGSYSTAALRHIVLLPE